MEIRDPIHGSIEVTPSESAVIDSIFFQRLRNIKQLGFTEFSYPGATHNRFAHSIGAMHLAGVAFDSIFQGFHFASKETRWRYRQLVRLASLLHDVGHGPLSHTTEEVMPPLKALNLKILKRTKQNLERRATHEDYTIKIITDSQLTETLSREFSDISPIHIAMLIDKNLPFNNEIFIHQGVDFRPLLSQVVSSELDVDRMDYLSRDSYYCGTSYGNVDYRWLITNLTFHEKEGKLYLALNRKALYTFDDFLIARYHMYLMVYFHYKGIIYDEMLLQYLKSRDCDFFLPSSIDEYLSYDDYKIHTHMRMSRNYWAQLISQRKPYRMIVESHDQKSFSLTKTQEILKENKIKFISASSTGRLCKYYEGGLQGKDAIFVVDVGIRGRKKVTPIERTTQVFEKYQDARKIERLYVSAEDYVRSQDIIEKQIK